MISAALKAALTPVAVVKDAVSVVTGDEPDATKQIIESSVEDLKEAADDLCDGEM